MSIEREDVFGNWLWHWATEQPDKAALIVDDQEIGWAELASRVTERMGFLQSATDTGDRVAWLGPNGPDFIEVFLACAHLGLIFVPLNTRLSGPEHRVQLDNCDPALVLGAPSVIEQLLQVEPIAQVLPDIGEWSTEGRSAKLGSSVESETDALIVYTSGTTGPPKGAVHTHGSLNATMTNGVACQDLVASDVALAFLPMFHVGGLNIQVLPTLAVGGTVVLHRAFDPGRVIADLEKYRATVSVFVPATMSAVLAQPEFTTADFSSLRGVMTGSSVVPTPLLESFIAAGIPPGQVYGLTETGPTTVVLRFDEAKHLGAAGQAAALAECQIVDHELQVRGPHLFNRYWDNEAATDAAFDGDWYRTGDRAHTDDQGMIRIEGRVDDMIVSGGENIFPEQIEDVLKHAPKVGDVAVIGRPHAKWGEVPVAVVVADGDPPTLEELRDFAAPSLARFKLPADLVIVEELPRTALGKLQKFKLH